MVQSSSQSATFTSLDQQLIRITTLVEQMQNVLLQTRSAAVPPFVYESTNQLVSSVHLFKDLVDAMEGERQSLRALAQVGQVINSSLDLNEVLQIVMDTIIHITQAERGFLMLRDEQGQMAIRMARNWEQMTVDASETIISRTVVQQVSESAQPILTTNAQEDPRFTGQESIQAFNLRSIMCVPLKVKDILTGVIYVDNRIRVALFNQKDLDLLTAFTNQAAVAIENARLFASVRQTLTEVTELKNLMDNVFASIASGVLTADVQERIVLCNRAAELILGQEASLLIGRDLHDVAPGLMPTLDPHMNGVLHSNHQVVGLDANTEMTNHGRMDLRVSMTPIKDAQQATQGVAIVMEDLTETKRLEAQQRLFERMVSPAVIDQLDPNSLHLGGKKTEITVLFADIRGFTSFTESLPPEEMVSVLNRYLSAAAEAVLNQEGTVDKFLGDAVMAWFNAPIPQPDHVLRAVRAAVAIREAVLGLHKVLPPEWRLSFGLGIHVGEAILGLVGNEKRLEYTALGDCVNTAKRIQENAGMGQILISQEAYLRVSDWVWGMQSAPIVAKGKRDPIAVYEVLKLR